MHCKVCADAGKDVSIYSSHRVKDFSGAVTCPTLLSQECRNCYRLGHTIKFCPELKAQDAYKAREERIKAYDLEQAAKMTQEKKTTHVNNVSRFAVLDDSYEDKKTSKTKNSKKNVKIAEPTPAVIVASVAPAKAIFSKDAFPTLSGEVASRGVFKIPVLEEKFSYKSIVATPTPVTAPCIAKKSSWLTPAEAVATLDAWSDEEDDFARPAFRNAIVQKIVGGAKLVKSNQKENWADIYSSDEEDW